MKIAVCSGASSGIGKEFAKQIDNYGFDEIWAVALEDDKLKQLKKELKTKIKTFALDLTKEESFASLKSELEKKKPDVKMLINCSGFGKFGRYDEIPQNDCDGMIDLNCKGYVRMTNVVLPYMSEESEIISVSSISAFAPVPYVGVYAATKAFVLSYCRSLNVELRHRKINITAVCPFWTKTKFFDRAKQTNNSVISYYSVMYNPEDVVAKALKDSKKKKEISVYGFKSNLQRFFLKLIPSKWFYSIWLKQQKIKSKYENKK